LAAVASKYKDFQALGTEATPSGWTPGKPVLKPGPDLVGKVWEAWKVENAF